MYIPKPAFKNYLKTVLQTWNIKFINYDTPL